jgi:predicted O-methyltransferase YrrM
MLYLEFLRRLHQLLQPRSYLEIGVRHGKSLALASAPAIGIDPRPELTSELGPAAHVIPTTSDAFFAAGDGLDHLPDRTIDLAFIDGMHLFEYAFRDFVNVERYCTPGSVVVLDDMLPRTPLEAARRRRTKAWTGDVWKVMPVLAEQRPDLVLLPVAVRPTGVLVVLCPDPAGQSDMQYGEPELRRLRRTPGPARGVVDRSDAVDPGQLLAAPFWGAVRSARDGLTSADDLREAVRAWQPVPLTPEQVEASKGSSRRDEMLPGPVQRIARGAYRRLRGGSGPS